MAVSFDFDKFLKKELNPEQHQAVIHKSGPLLIIAGAGSGKTRVITARIAHLITKKSVIPAHILALTFTNKAALEMKERIHSFIGNEQGFPFIGTFHSYCLRFLKTHQEKLSKPFLAILDEDDQQKILQGIITRNALNKKITAKQISYHISHIKNTSLNPEHEFSHQKDHYLYDIYRAYEHEKNLSKCFDFDDLLLETVKLLKANPTLKKEHQKNIAHILVDEYQDTNIVQHELLKCLSLNEKNKLILDSLCAVGDEDQSIYSWRGATVENILQFQHDFPGTQIIKIEQNYRSVTPILETANAVIAHNKNRNVKNLWSIKQANDRIRLISCLSEYQEADAVIQCIKASVAQNNPLSSHAILYRAHFQSRALEEALIKSAMAYKIIGGIQFYERKEIKDLLAYLRLIINPFDRASFFRVINCPIRGLGAKFEEELINLWENQPFLSGIEVLTKGIDEQIITGIKKDAVKEFLAIFETVKSETKPSKALSMILEKTAYFSYLKKNYDQQEAQERIDNVKELHEAIIHAEQEKTATISSFLDEVALMQTKKNAENETADTIILMTLHAAKGLEFPHVIIIGLEEGVLPSTRSLASSEAIEEERRLLYVGITRAQERLFLSQVKYRYNYGTMTEQRPSRFLMEIPESLAPRIDCSYWSAAQLYQQLVAWIKGKNSAEFSTIVTFSSAKKSETEEKKIAPFDKLRMNAHVWKKNQPVAHDSFGVGIIQDIELKGNQKTYLTVKFKSGVKKIAAEFIKSV